MTSLVFGCAHSRPGESPEAVQSQVAELRTQLAALSSRLEGMEGKLTALNGKIETTQPAAGGKVSVTPVVTPPSEGAGSPVSASPAASDPEVGFVNDVAIQSFRRAMILLNGGKNAEAVLAFSSFVEQFPDHPLAGSAQFYVGESYFRQKEYKLALHEYRRVLTSYDRSSHVSETLRQMAEAEDALKLPEEAAKHRQLLTSLFPQAPAANFSRMGKTPPAEHATPDVAPGSSGLDEPPPTAPVAPPAAGQAGTEAPKATQ